jgi:hypothetical protein
VKLCSPNELLKAAKDQMLAGADPHTDEEWARVFNFLAANIAPGVQPAALLFFRAMYDVPLTKDEICAISKFQIERKA